MAFRVREQLKPRLSSGAQIFGPDDSEFPGLASRWREYHAPTVAAIVQVATEGDVQEAVSPYTDARTRTQNLKAKGSEPSPFLVH
jgi:hypothetical protein